MLEGKGACLLLDEKSSRSGRLFGISLSLQKQIYFQAVKAQHWQSLWNIYHGGPCLRPMLLLWIGLRKSARLKRHFGCSYEVKSEVASFPVAHHRGCKSLKCLNVSFRFQVILMRLPPSARIHTGCFHLAGCGSLS